MNNGVYYNNNNNNTTLLHSVIIISVVVNRCSRYNNYYYYILLIIFIWAGQSQSVSLISDDLLSSTLWDITEPISKMKSVSNNDGGKEVLKWGGNFMHVT